jgi:hypothetical protein
MKSLNTAINKNFVFGILCIVLTCSQAWATNYYVSISGRDSNPGTQLQPWRTIGKAASTLASGDTVYVQAGTYAETVAVGASGADASHYITYQANGTVNVRRWLVNSKNYVIIDGFHSIDAWSPAELDYLVSIYGTSSYITVQNMTLTMPNAITVGPCTNLAGLIQTYYTVSHITITGNTLSRSCGLPAISTCGDSNTYTNNTIFDILTDAFMGEGLTNSTIRGNTIGPFIDLGYHSDCFQLFTSNSPSYINTNVLIENNVCHDGDQPGNMSQDESTSTGITIRNNIFYNFNGTFGLGIKHTYVYNNVFWRCATNEALWTALGVRKTDGGEVKNNFFIGCGGSGGGAGYNTDYGTGYNCNESCNPTVASASNNFYARDPSWTNPWGAVPFAVASEPNMINGGNPLFTNYEKYDFTLQVTSPAIDKGATIPSFAVDKNGVSRPQRSAWDIGPYEIIRPPSPPRGLKIIQ